MLADLGDLVREKLAKGVNVNGGARWYSTTTHQDVDGLPQFPRIRPVSFNLVTPKLRTFPVDGKDAAGCTMPFSQQRPLRSGGPGGGRQSGSGPMSAA